MANLKDKFMKAVSIAVITAISGALIAYLNNPENRALLANRYQEYSYRLGKQAKKTRKTVNKKLSGFRI